MLEAKKLRLANLNIRASSYVDVLEAKKLRLANLNIWAYSYVDVLDVPWTILSECFIFSMLKLSCIRNNGVHIV